MTHPFQEQVSATWDLIKLNIRAQRQESWIEALSLSYTILEVQLRLLLRTSEGKGGMPVPVEDIEERGYLISLADLALEREFIDEPLRTRMQVFNDVRRRAIHRFAQGEIGYEDMKGQALQASTIMGQIQGWWINVELGPEEKLKTK
jgi:hypothetical protein